MRCSIASPTSASIPSVSTSTTLTSTVSASGRRPASPSRSEARMRELLDGRVALITGAASGQGQQAARLFAQQGAAIAVVDINDDGSAETVATVEEAGSKAVAIHADVSVRDDCDRMVAETIDALGSVDVLYNNAAVQMSGRLVECTVEDWDLTIATNLNA